MGGGIERENEKENEKEKENENEKDGAEIWAQKSGAQG